MSQVGSMLNARFEALEGRLLPEVSFRPKLKGQLQTQAISQQQQRSIKSYAKATTDGNQAKRVDPKGSDRTDKRTGKAKPRLGLKQTDDVNMRVQEQLTLKGKDMDGWTTVTGTTSRRLKGVKNIATIEGKQKIKTSKIPKKDVNNNNKRITKTKINLPRNAAVVITPNVEQEVTRTELIKEARSKINLEEIGIDYIRPKIAITGAVILEIPGEDGKTKADKLASKLREALSETKARITRPIKRTDLRISGLDESIAPSEIAEAMATFGECRVDECKIGEIRRAPTGLGIAWANCPATAAKKLAEISRIKVGWVMARVEALSPRPLQCYRCLEPGHTRARCTATLDRSGRCYRCGQNGHTARSCTEKPNCPLCSDIGRPSGHRLESVACAPPQKRRGTVKGQINQHERTKLINNKQQEETMIIETSATARTDEETPLSPKPRRAPREKAGIIKSQEECLPSNMSLPTSPTSTQDRNEPEEAMDITQ